MNANDHRNIGRDLKIFYSDDDIGKGLPLWLPNGAAIREELERLLKELEFKAGFHRVASPHIARESLFERSGHLSHFSSHMFPAMRVDESEVYRLRPMNCPHHHAIYRSSLRSYRDLPLRLAEFGQVYRLEDSGALSGLMRVRGLCQNDAHIYCSSDQVREELKAVLEMHFEVYRLLGIDDFRLRLSLWDEKTKYVDDPDGWIVAQNLLRECLIALELPFEEAQGEAAFYGPKIDVQLISALGREETFSTIQLDFASARRMDLFYIGADGEKHHPYILHRAPIGTHERMVAFLLERNGGWLPTWLSPVQVRVLPVGEAEIPAAQELASHLRHQMIRAEVSMPFESLQRRIRESFLAKVPNLAVLGKREISSKSIMLRERGAENSRLVGQSEFLSQLKERIENRVFDLR